MTEQELFEFAAKAAGVQGFYLVYDGEEFRYGIASEDKLWNPIENDSDAFRLLVDLNLDMDHGWEVVGGEPKATVCVQNREGTAWANEIKGDDPYAAARCAIVHVAAKIGEKME
jgi:hypothetical protein